MVIPKSKVYALVDAQNRITRIEGGYSMENIQDISAWTYLDEGYGDRYNLCQTNYLHGGIMTMDGVYRYKLVDGMPVLRTDAEIQADRDARPAPPPTPLEILEAENDRLKAQITMQSEQLVFLEDCILEIGDVVYA